MVSLGSSRSSWEAFERHGTELALQVHSRPNLLWFIRYMRIYLSLWRKRKVWGVGHMEAGIEMESLEDAENGQEQRRISPERWGGEILECEPQVGKVALIGSGHRLKMCEQGRRSIRVQL